MKLSVYQSIIAGVVAASSSSMMLSANAQVVSPVEAMTEPVPYQGIDGMDLLGHLSVPTEGDGPFPAIIIVPDWDGVNEYEQQRATLVTEEWGKCIGGSDACSPMVDRV
jgi:hypothetical protein